MSELERGGRGTTPWPRRAALLTNVLIAVSFAVVLVLLIPATGYGAMSVARADLSGGLLVIEGTATPNRTITVDGIALATSGADGRFRIELAGFAAPADCTVDVNDGSATPTNARLTGCTAITRPVSRLR